MAEYINRDALLKELMLDPIGRMLIKRYNLDGFIKAQPKAEPVKHGTWEKVVPSRWGSLFECSECGEKTTESVMGKPRYEYCPMCGAKMDGEQP